MNQSKEKIVWLDIMKFYGILLVVFGHIAMIYTDMSLIHPKEPSSMMVCIKNIIYSFHMPMFIFISGYIFGYQLEWKRKKINFWNLFQSKIKRLMIPFYIFGFLWVLPTMVILGFRDLLHYAIDGFVYALDPRHLWFVMTLFFCYIMFYICRYSLIKLHLPITLILIFSLILYIFPFGIAYFQLNNVQEYFLWFSLGYFCFLYKEKKEIGFVIIALCAILFIITINLEENNETILKISSAIIGIFIFYLISIKSISLNDTKIGKIINSNSFGIYLFHPMIIYVLGYKLSKFSINPIFLTSVIFVATLFLSILFTEVTRKIGLGICIGEKSMICTKKQIINE